MQPLEESREGKQSRETAWWWDLLQSLVVAAVLAVIIRAFLFTPFYIPSPSMEPTLYPGDRIIVNRLAYRLGDPQRGDVVVFHYPLDPSRDYIKRVVAVGGDTVEARNNVLYVNGQPQPPEKYLPPGVVYSDFGPVKVPPNNYFMMGDNRNNSADSRVWGTLDRRLVIGKAMFIFWPLNRLGLIR
ncbi:signal peptidase I [Neomoorella thermoacetica]|uniref:Signal peptidase I n=2 Tax=Neomoorella thermoacetica TaxID=1525 RepID=A0A1D7X9Q0_NEOTH|nr:signal peptidase I [Moorella thermoacetica]AKX93731.1 signal peptidase I T [Moorella thermoacetica]AKX96373.1 signal peptidase I T [Moorella thermoacetica]AOQ23653.1 Signal peptidase I T [Moorella thermoacetica]APC08090.1 signal peptidase I T [Moorella thermoacetica]OIQ09620.1 signal peptidase I T [Moorella thermoacetica]